MNNTPYSNLDPHLILAAVETLGFQCSGSLLALNSYENRVYQIGLEEGRFLVAKFYRPGRWTDEMILEEHQFAWELQGQELPVIAPLQLGKEKATLHEYLGFRFALFPRQGGRPLELDNVEQLEWMGRFIGRLHAIGACRPFQHRLHLDVQTFGFQPYQFLIENQFIPAELRQNYCMTVEFILQKIEGRFQEVGELTQLRLHGDCHAGNVLWRPSGPHIVDLDDCLTGPAVQDIWMLLSGDQQDVKKQLQAILEGYLEFHDFNRRELKLIEALRSLRMLHYSGWLARRWDDPTFPLNFPWFNTPRYWQEQLEHLREQAALLDEESDEN